MVKTVHVGSLSICKNRGLHSLLWAGSLIIKLQKPGLSALTKSGSQQAYPKP